MATDFKIFEQPQGRSFTTWTPGLLRVALAYADGGSLRNLAELCEALLGDDRIQGVFDTRTGGLLALTPTFEASGDGRKKGRAVRALEAEEDWWEIAPEDELAQVLNWGRLMGLGPYQHVWKEHRGRAIPAIRFWHPRNLRYNWQTRGWFTRVASASGFDSGEEVPFTPGDGQWGLYTPYGPFRPWAHGLWRGLSRFWLLKSYAIDDWGRLGESASRLVAKSEKATTPELRKQLASDLFQLARDSTLVLPEGMDLKLVEASAATREIYEKQLKVADTAFAVTVLGQNLTTEVKEGSLAAATAHERVENQRLKADGQAASSTIHDQSIEWWAEFNFGSRDLAPWPLWPTDPPEDNERTVKVWLQFGQALQAFQTAGLRIDAPEMATKLGVPLLKEADPSDTDPGSKAEREQKAQEAAEQQHKPEPTDDDAGETGPEAGRAGGDENRSAAARVRLVSGDDPKAAAGFVEGQSYADALTDRGAERGAEALKGFVAELDDLLAGIDSLETARDAIVSFYRDALAPEELAAKAEALFVMAHRAGAGAVQQDTPEVDFES